MFSWNNILIPLWKINFYSLAAFFFCWQRIKNARNEVDVSQQAHSTRNQIKQFRLCSYGGASTEAKRAVVNKLWMCSTNVAKNSMIMVLVSITRTKTRLTPKNELNFWISPAILQSDETESGGFYIRFFRPAVEFFLSTIVEAFLWFFAIARAKKLHTKHQSTDKLHYY